MASVIVMTNPLSEIDYSLADSRVRSFTLRGRVLYDEDAMVAVEGWERTLAEFVNAQGFAIDSGDGVPAFIHWLAKKGLLEGY
jgi:hypothetical protein